MKGLALFIIVGAFSSAGIGQRTIKVYFHNEKQNPKQADCNKVFAVTRTIPDTFGVAKAALEELFKGTTKEDEEKDFWGFLPAETKGILKSVNVKNDTAYVNFTEKVYEQLGAATTSCGGGFFAMLENTLMQFPKIKKVFYAIEGNPADFYDWVQVGECPKELKNCSGKDFQ